MLCFCVHNPQRPDAEELQTVLFLSSFHGSPPTQKTSNSSNPGKIEPCKHGIRRLGVFHGVENTIDLKNKKTVNVSN